MFVSYIVMNKISICTTHRIIDDDTAYLSEQCISRIKQHTTGEYQLIAIDNASDAKYSSMLQYNVDTYVRNDTNLGNPVAWDQGVGVSTEDIIILMDNDCWPLNEGWNEQMVQRVSNSDVGIAFPYSILGDDINLYESGVNVIFKGRKDGFCFAFNKDTYKHAGPFLVDQPFKLGYYEDDNFYANVQFNLKLKLVTCPDSKMWHKGQGTSKKMWTEDFAMGIERNRLWYNKKWNDRYIELD